MSKDSADAATVMRWIEREKTKSRMKTVTEILPAPALLLLCKTQRQNEEILAETQEMKLCE